MIWKSIAGLTKNIIVIVKTAMRHTLTLCKNVRWTLGLMKPKKGHNMKTKTTKIKKISETDAEKRLLKTLKRMGLV